MYMYMHGKYMHVCTICAAGAHCQFEELGCMVGGSLGVDDFAEDKVLHGLAVWHDGNGRQSRRESGNRGAIDHGHLRASTNNTQAFLHFASGANFPQVTSAYYSTPHLQYTHTQ